MFAEIVFGISGVTFTTALFPMLLDRFGLKPAWLKLPGEKVTAALTGSMLVLMAVAFATIGQIPGAISTAATAVAWVLILFAPKNPRKFKKKLFATLNKMSAHK